MVMAQDDFLWAPRVPRQRIRRLYESDAQGLLDEELLQEVGFALLARCKDIIEVTEACSGRAHCRRCGGIIPRRRYNFPDEDEEELQCQACGWKTTWKAFFYRFSGHKLRGGEVLHVYATFVESWHQAKSAHEKMLAIDDLIHEFHTYAGKPGKPVAVTVIGGSSTEVNHLLEFLANRTGKI